MKLVVNPPRRRSRKVRLDTLVYSHSTYPLFSSGDPDARKPCTSRAQFVKQLVLFVTVKLAHELFHLLNRMASPKTKTMNLTPPRIKTDVMLNSDIVDVSYNDFGTMMERDAMGGCWELTSTLTRLFMVPEYVVVYPSTATKEGRYLDVEASSIDARGANVVLYGVHRSRFSPTFSASMLKGGYARISEYVKIGSGSFDQQWAEGDDEEEGEVGRFSRL
jgi:hypothetical protein